jgi:opacity protein-like surface antigen
MKTKITTLIGLVNILIFIEATAAEKENGAYVQFNTGYVMGYDRTDNDRFVYKDYLGNESDSIKFGIAAGYKFNKNFRADLSLDYMTLRNKYHAEYYPEGCDAICSVDPKVKGNSLISMVNIYYDIIEMNNLTPYLTIGGGVSINKVKSAKLVFYDKTGIYTKQHVTQTFSRRNKTNFVWKVGLGTKVSLNNNIDLDLRYQFQDLGRYKTGNQFISDDEPDITGQYYPYSGHIKLHEILLGLVYNF